MSFNMVGLGPVDQAAIRLLSPLIITTLRQAARIIQQGGGLAESDRWFGDSAAAWMGRLGTTLNRMASVVNVEDIQITFRSVAHRKGSFAAASAPASGWGTYTSVSGARGQNFRIALDTAWNKTPLFRPAGQPADSMFQTLVHELSHLIIESEDHEYGVDPCLELARNSPYKAKENADNFGYFVEEFH
jgi:hypothetical protein